MPWRELPAVKNAQVTPLKEGEQRTLAPSALQKPA